MPSIRSFPLPWATLIAESTSEVFLCGTGWMSAPEIEKVRVTWELTARTGEFEVTTGFQTAQFADSPDSHTKIDATFQSADDVIYPANFTDLSDVTDGKQLIRFGWVVKLTDATP